MAITEHKNFFKSIAAAAKFYPQYLFIGEEDLLLDECLAALQKSFLSKYPESNNDFNLEHFYADRADPARIQESCSTMPLGAAMKLVIVHHLEKMNETKRSELAEFLKQAEPAAALVLLWNNRPNATVLNHDLCLNVAQNGQVVKCWKPFETQRPEWVRQEVQAQGKTIAQNACLLLAQEGGESLSELKTEIEKCILFCADKKEIDLTMVQKVLSFGRNSTIWNFLEFFEAGEIKKAANALQDCLDQEEEPVKIIAMLARSLRSGGKPSWSPGGFSKPKKQWSQKQLQILIPLLKNMDLGFKSGQSRESALLETFLVQAQKN